jgi:hypothetical protein
MRGVGLQVVLPKGRVACHKEGVVSMFPDEAPVDEELLEELTRQATFAADLAYFANAAIVQTQAQMTRVLVRAALRNLIANRLIDVKSLDEISAIIENGVTMQ